MFVENLLDYALSELDSAPLAKKLNLSAMDFDLIDDSWHPEDFQWRGMQLHSIQQNTMSDLLIRHNKLIATYA
jgi:hypothetical protein